MASRGDLTHQYKTYALQLPITWADIGKLGPVDQMLSKTCYLCSLWAKHYFYTFKGLLKIYICDRDLCGPQS